MQGQPKGIKTKTHLSARLSKSLTAYGLAASAAGVGVLALVQPADARVIFTKTQQKLGPLHPVINIDLNNDGTQDFRMAESAPSFAPSHASSFLDIRGGPGHFVTVDLAHQGQGGEAAPALPAGVAISSENKFEFRSLFMYGCGRNSSCIGPWHDAKNRYLGLKILINGEAHFGWARISVHRGGFGMPIHALLTGYAYETEPGKAIVTGDTGELQEHPTLGQLARGASGISSWRTPTISAQH